MRKQVRTMILEANGASAAGAFHGVFEPREEDGEARRWWRIQLDGRSTAPQVQLFPNLFEEPFRLHVDRVEEADPNDQAALDRLCGTRHLSTTTEVDRRAEIRAIDQRMVAVGVIDVGQGSMNAFLDAEGVPIAYFDVGGGVTTNRRTWPQDLTELCLLKSKVFILSHWDLDHWAAHQRCLPFAEHPEAYAGSTWIVPVDPPRDRPAVTVARFVDRLKEHGARILVCPPRFADITEGRVTLKKCSGTSRNDSGLVIQIDGDDERGDVLLPGDASLDVIPNLDPGDLGLIVAPHHGSRTSNEAVGVKDNAAVVLSFGKRNTFGHPDFRTLRHWRNVDWTATADRTKVDGVERSAGVLIEIAPGGDGQTFHRCPISYEQRVIPKPRKRKRRRNQ